MTKTKQINPKDKIESRLERIERYVGNHRGEVKATYQGFGYVPTTTGGTFQMSGIAVGDDIQTRTGSRINLHRVLRNVVYNMTKTCTVRILIYRDKMNQGAFANVNDVLENNDVTSTYHFRNVIQTKRFVILHDESQNFSINGKLSHTSIKSIPHECRISFRGDTAAIGDQGQNSLYMIVITDVATPGNLNFTHQIHFTDE